MIFWLYTLLSFAEEGLWPTESIPHNPLWSAVEAQLTNRASTLLVSTVSLPNCTGALISNTGLTITNAHCIHHYVKKSDTTFHASSTKDEYIIPNLYMYITVSVTNVDKEVYRRISDTALPSYVTYRKKRNQRVILRSCRNKHPQYRCTIHFDTTTEKYQLVKEEKIDDVRMVHLPSGTSLHPDIALLRLYKKNHPLQTVQHLTATISEPEVHTPIAALGYPNTSHRYPHPTEWNFQQEILLPKTRLYAQQALSVLQHSTSEHTGRLREMIQEIDTNAHTLLNLYTQEAPFSQVQERSSDFLMWSQQDPARQKWAQSFLQYKDIIEKQNVIQQKLMELRWLSLSSKLLFSARRRYGWRKSREIPDAQRIKGYRDQDKERLILHLQQVSEHGSGEQEKEMLAFMLSQSSLLPISQFLQSFSDISDAITHLYQNTEPLLSMRDSLLHINPRHPLPSNPWLSLGRDLEQLFFDLTATQKEYNRLQTQYYNQYVQGIKSWKTNMFYPDADGSLRISFGTILSNGNLFPSTSLLGKGSSLLYGYHRRIPFFISNVDATHGSSGSVTINQKGEWIGLLFGGNDNRHTSAFFFAKNTGHHHISTSNILWYFSSNPNWKNIISEMMPKDE